MDIPEKLKEETKKLAFDHKLFFNPSNQTYYLTDKIKSFVCIRNVTFQEVWYIKIAWCKKLELGGSMGHHQLFETPDQAIDYLKERISTILH